MNQSVPYLEGEYHMSLVFRWEYSGFAAPMHCPTLGFGGGGGFGCCTSWWTGTPARAEGGRSVCYGPGFVTGEGNSFRAETSLDAVDILRMWICRHGVLGFRRPVFQSPVSEGPRVKPVPCPGSRRGLQVPCSTSLLEGRFLPRLGQGVLSFLCVSNIGG